MWLSNIGDRLVSLLSAERTIIQHIVLFITAFYYKCDKSTSSQFLNPTNYIIESRYFWYDSWVQTFHKLHYYSFKIFPRFWLAKTTRIIYLNQLLLTKFGNNFVVLNRWRQNDVKSAPWLQVIKPSTEKTWGRGSLILAVRTKWLDSWRNILLVSRRNIL